MQNLILHRGLEIPLPYTRPVAIPLPETSEGWLEIIEPAFPGEFPPVDERLPLEPSLQVH